MNLETTSAQTLGFYDPLWVGTNETDKKRGRVQAIVEVNGVVYVGGLFPHVVDTDGTDFANTYQFLCAFDASTGALIRSWKPAPNGDIYQLVVSQDQSTIYAVGSYTQMAGVTRQRVSAFSVLSGPSDTRAASSLLLANPNITVDDYVRALSLDETNHYAYIAGDFANVEGAARGELARLDVDATTGAWTLDAWHPAALTGGDVRSILLKPDGTKLIVGGPFTGPAPTNIAFDTSTGAQARFDYAPSTGDRGDGFTYRLLPNLEGTQVIVSGGASGGNSLVSVDWNGTGPVTFSNYKVTWFYQTDGNVQQIFVGHFGNDEVVFAGHHGDYIGTAVDMTNANGQTVTRHGLLTVRASDGKLETFGHPPDFYSPKTCAGADTGTPLKVWAIYQNAAGVLFTGGDFTSTTSSACATANSQRRFARFNPH